MAKILTLFRTVAFNVWKVNETKKRPGGRHGSVVLSTPPILRPGFESQEQHLCLKNKKESRDGAGSFFKKMMQRVWDFD